jgi:hypothetical protein
MRAGLACDQDILRRAGGASTKCRMPSRVDQEITTGLSTTTSALSSIPRWVHITLGSSVRMRLKSPASSSMNPGDPRRSSAGSAMAICGPNFLGLSLIQTDNGTESPLARTRSRHWRPLDQAQDPPGLNDGRTLPRHRRRRVRSAARRRHRTSSGFPRESPRSQRNLHVQPAHCGLKAQTPRTN